MLPDDAVDQGQPQHGQRQAGPRPRHHAQRVGGVVEAVQAACLEARVDPVDDHGHEQAAQQRGHGATRPASAAAPPNHDGQDDAE